MAPETSISIGCLPPKNGHTPSSAAVVKAHTPLVGASPWPVQLALKVHGPVHGPGEPLPRSKPSIW